MQTRVVDEGEDDGTRDVEKINFDPTVKDWGPKEVKKRAELIVVGAESGHVDTVVRKIRYKQEKRKSEDDINLRKYVLSSEEEEHRRLIILENREKT